MSNARVDGALKIDLVPKWWESAQHPDAVAELIVGTAGLAWPSQEASQTDDIDTATWTSDFDVADLLRQRKEFNLRGRAGAIAVMFLQSQGRALVTLRFLHYYLDNSVVVGRDFDLRGRLRRFCENAARSSSVRWLGPDNYLMGCRTHEYRRPRPPPHRSGFVSGALWQVLDQRYHAMEGKLRVDVPSWSRFEAFRDAPLPAGATRQTVGDLVFVDFGGDLEDLESVKVAASAQEQWLAPIVKTTDNNFTEDGDFLTSVGEPSDDPDLTFYAPSVDPKNRHEYPDTAYKGVVPDAAGRLDADDLARYSAMLKEGQTPGGTPFQQLVLVAPTRDVALACLEQAREAGATSVYYPSNLNTGGTPMDDGGMVFYDVAPPGLWLN